jgi:hypothetical protein
MSDRYLAACDALGLRADAPWLTGETVQLGQIA